MVRLLNTDTGVCDRDLQLSLLTLNDLCDYLDATFDSEFERVGL